MVSFSPKNIFAAAAEVARRTREFAAEYAAYAKEHPVRTTVTVLLPVAATIGPMGVLLFPVYCIGFIAYPWLMGTVEQDMDWHKTRILQRQTTESLARVSALLEQGQALADFEDGLETGQVVALPNVELPDSINPFLNPVTVPYEKLEPEYKATRRVAPLAFAISLASIVAAVTPMYFTLSERAELTNAAYDVGKKAATDALLANDLDIGTAESVKVTYGQKSLWLWIGDYATTLTVRAQISDIDPQTTDYVTIDYNNGTAQKYHIRDADGVPAPPQGYESGVIEYIPSGVN